MRVSNRRIYSWSVALGDWLGFERSPRHDLGLHAGIGFVKKN